MSSHQEIAAAGLPMSIAAACVREAVRQGYVATCSGRSQDMERDIDKRICRLTGRRPGRVSQGRVAFHIWRSPRGDRVWFETSEGVFDHVIGRDDANKLIAAAARP